MKHVSVSILLAVSCIWLEAYVVEHDISGQWAMLIHIAVTVGLIVSAFWFAAGAAKLIGGKR